MRLLASLMRLLVSLLVRLLVLLLHILLEEEAMEDPVATMDREEICLRSRIWGRQIETAASGAREREWDGVGIRSDLQP